MCVCVCVCVFIEPLPAEPRLFPDCRKSTKKQEQDYWRPSPALVQDQIDWQILLQVLNPATDVLRLLGGGMKTSACLQLKRGGGDARTVAKRQDGG